MLLNHSFQVTENSNDFSSIEIEEVRKIIRNEFPVGVYLNEILIDLRNKEVNLFL